jgi:hypothetical protein
MSHRDFPAGSCLAVRIGLDRLRLRERIQGMVTLQRLPSAKQREQGFVRELSGASPARSRLILPLWERSNWQTSSIFD